MLSLPRSVPPLPHHQLSPFHGFCLRYVNVALKSLTHVCQPPTLPLLAHRLPAAALAREAVLRFEVFRSLAICNGQFLALADLAVGAPSHRVEFVIVTIGDIAEWYAVVVEARSDEI